MAEKGRIEEVNAPAPSEAIPTRGLEALATAGRRLGALGNERAAAIRQAGGDIARGLRGFEAGTREAGAVLQQHDNTQDILHGASVAADLQLNLAQQWKQVQSTADPNDPNVGRNFLDNVVTPALTDFQSGFQTKAGQQWGTSHSASAMQHWTNQIIQGQAQLAGKAAQGNLENITLATTASVATDPSHLPLALDQISSSFDMAAQTGNLTPEERGHLTGAAKIAAQKEVIMTAGKAMVETNPNVDLNGFFKSYGSRIGGPAMETLTAYQAVRQRTDQTRQKQENTDQFNQRVDQSLTSVIQPDGRLIVPRGYYDNILSWATLPGADPRKIESAINFGRAIDTENASGKKDTTDPEVKARFDAQLYNTENPLTVQAVYEAKIQHKLSSEDFSAYHGYAEQAQKPGMTAENQQIKANQKIAEDFLNPKNPSTGLPNMLVPPDGGPVVMRDPSALTAVAMFNTQFNAGVARARSAGTLTEYLTPGSALYWGNSINLRAIQSAAKAQYGSQFGTVPVTPAPTATEAKPSFGEWLGKNLGDIFGTK